ncbi:hypothetical protein ACQY0O_005140 [Thecaphora frezii]
METHITTLGATLHAINRRQALARKRARTGITATPFTTAVLNRERLEIFAYIRDADPHTEANLFHYPPPPQSQQTAAAPSHFAQRNPSAAAAADRRQQNKSNKDNNNLDDHDADQLLALRLPQPRRIQPPTPLRRTIAARSRTADLGPASSNDAAPNATTLLLAAQKLNDDYHSAPKARKHIKALLKKHAELSRTIKESERQVKDCLDRIEQARARQATAGLGTKTAPSAASAPSSSGKELRDELKRVHEAQHTEELEILALEELISDLQEEAKKKRSAETKMRRTTPAAEERTAATTEMPVAPPPVAEAVEDKAAGLGPVADPEGVVDASPIGPAATAAGSQKDLEPTGGVADDGAAALDEAAKQQDGEEGDEEGDDADAGDATVRAADEMEAEVAGPSTSSAAAADAEEAEVMPDPATWPELERITANIWRLFGDALRHVTPDTHSADVGETVRLLRLVCDGRLARSSSGDTSLVSHTTSTSTSYTDSSPAMPTTPFTADMAMTAYIIVRMLSTPEPHSMNIEDLKNNGGIWWKERGRGGFVEAVRDEEGDDRWLNNVPEDGMGLARKAIYALVSKQVFGLRRSKGVGTVEFA